MKHKRKLLKIDLIILALVTFLVIALGYFIYQYASVLKINDFESCQAAGYPILESYPARCVRPDGKSFTQEIGSDGVVCTMEAILCPDGTYVGRTGPKCEFVCP